MAKSDKAFDPRREGEGWDGRTENPPATAGGASPVPVGDQEDAIAALLGDSASFEVGRRRARWRNVRWLLVLIPILAIATPLILWSQYQASHVTSRNAAVRGHLAEIGSRLNGIVAQVFVDVGDEVRAGDLLAEFDSRHLSAQVQEARADVAGLETSVEVERLSIGLERKQIAQQRDEVRARADAAMAQTEAARVEAEEASHALELRKSLFEREGAVSSEEVRAANSDYRSAVARLQEAEANEAVTRSVYDRLILEEDGLAIREQRIGVLEADLLRARARLERAEADVGGAAVRAPEDGSILRRIVQPGGSVDVGQPVLAMWLGKELWVEAWIDEEDIGHVRVGDRATVTLHSFGGQELEGEVDKIGLATDLEIPETEVPQPRGTRMSGAPVVGVRIRLLDPPAGLLPGLSASVAIEKDE